MKEKWKINTIMLITHTQTEEKRLSVDNSN